MQKVEMAELSKLIRLCGLELENICMAENKSETYHELKHSFKEEIIVPTVALTNTFDFFMYGSAKKNIKLADGTLCIAEGYEEKHICDLEEDIKRLYNMDAWSFVKKWHKHDSLMTNMMFVKIWLKKNENITN